MVRDETNVSGALSNRKHGLFHIKYFENGPQEPGYTFVRRDFPCILYLIRVSYLAFVSGILAVIYIEFALSCFSSLKLYTFYFNVYI